MSFSQYKLNYIKDRLQVIEMTSNGYLVQSCNTLIDLEPYRDRPLYKSFPFLFDHHRAIQNMQDGSPCRRSNNVSFSKGDEDFHFDLSIFKVEAKIVVIFEERPVPQAHRREGKKLNGLNGNALNASALAEGEKLNLNGNGVSSGLKEEVNRLKKLGQMKQDYFSKVTHDIKLPLTEIVGTTYMLKNNISDEKRKQYVQSLGESATSLDKMLRDLLEFSKIESKKLKEDRKPFLLEQVLNNIVTTFDYKCSVKNVPIILELDPAVPPFLQGDSHWLRRIIYNLLDNALKFTEAGRIELRVRLKELEVQNCKIEIAVSDTGIGIPTEKLNTIFQAYEQVNAKDATRGFGLGLNIVQQLVELSGGAIKVESVVNQGTTFRLNLPYEVKSSACE